MARWTSSAAPPSDSPSVFCSLLDAEKGGYFSIKPTADSYVTKQLYFPDSAMLITRFMTPDGVGEVQDFMPVIEGRPPGRHRMVRHLRVASRQMQFVMDLQLRHHPEPRTRPARRRPGTIPGDGAVTHRTTA